MKVRQHKNKLGRVLLEHCGGSDALSFGNWYTKYQLLLKFYKEAKATLLILGKDKILEYHGYSSIDQFFVGLMDGSLEVGNYRLPKWIVKKLFPGWKPLVRESIPNQGTFVDILNSGCRARRRMRERRNDMSSPKILKLIQTIHRFNCTAESPQTHDKSVEITLELPSERLSMISAQQIWLAKYATKFIDGKKVKASDRWASLSFTIVIRGGRIEVIDSSATGGIRSGDKPLPSEYTFLKSNKQPHVSSLEEEER